MSPKTRYQLSVTDSAEDFVEHHFRRGFTKNVMIVLIGLLERMFGTRPLIEIPPELYDESPERIKLSAIISKLREIGVVDSVRLNMFNFSDEPFQYSADAGIHGHGHDFFLQETAIWKALGEGVERHYWLDSDSFYKNKTITSPYREIEHSALDIFKLAGFSDEQKQKHSSLQFDKDTEFAWVHTESLTENNAVYCPLSLVSGKYFDSTKEPMLRWGITTGLATAATRKSAVLKGLLEIIERDSFMISYLNKLSPPTIDLDSINEIDDTLHTIVKNISSYNIEPHLVVLPTDFPVHVVLAVLRDKTNKGPAITLGARAGFDISKCVLDALSEALIVRYVVKDMLDVRVDTSSVGRTERILYWTKHENKHKLDFLLDGDAKPLRSFANLPINKEGDDKKLSQILNTVNEMGYKAYTIEITPPEVGKIGFRSFFSIVPELQPMHLEESVPYIGGNRLKQVPEKFGYVPLNKLNDEPHPFP